MLPFFCWLGGKLIATSENGTIRYIHQDSLSSTSLVTDNAGNQIGTTVKYLPFGETRASVTVPADKRLPRRVRLYRAKDLTAPAFTTIIAGIAIPDVIYDPTIGRFISADTVIPNFTNPQCFNRYSYCSNNPLKYTDPSGHFESDYWNLITLGKDMKSGKTVSDACISATLKSACLSQTARMIYIPPSRKLDLFIQPTDIVYGYRNSNTTKNMTIGDDFLSQSSNLRGQTILEVNGESELIINQHDYKDIMSSGWTQEELVEVIKANPGKPYVIDSSRLTGYGQLSFSGSTQNIRYTSQGNTTLVQIFASGQMVPSISALIVTTSNGGIATYYSRNGPNIDVGDVLPGWPPHY
jgi:hypothetical protein